MTNPIHSDNRVLKLNVGFFLKEGAGYSREFHFDESGIITADDVQFSHLHGTLRLTRTPQGILIQGQLQAQRDIECVRCLTSFTSTFVAELSDLFIYPAPPVNLSAADQHVVSETGFIDLTPIMRDECLLGEPLQALCKPDCKGLCAQCGQNLNDGTCDCDQASVDPRLAPLRTLLDGSDYQQGDVQ